VAERALAAGIPLLRPERVGDAESVAGLTECAPDLGIVVAFGQFIPKPIRTLPQRGYLINGHASLLPRYRGASPIAQAILDGEKYTGVSVMRVEREMDTGPVALAHRIEIGEQENTGELTGRLADLAAQALLEAVESIAAGRDQWTEQNPEHASLAPKIGRADAEIDWSRSALQCARQIHAMAPKPGAFTQVADAEGKTSELKILRARIERSGSPAQPGELKLAASSEDPALRIGTGEGWLIPLEIQRAGGKSMDPDAFLRGHPLLDGAVLGAPPERGGGP